ncbi:hypothetical protein G6F35_016826 [Rhizopus arrhizus]|nr:hypothetical protein G6F35_016826 [Rhizopus arrhizus]
MPSAPRAASLRTHSRPCSGVWIVFTRSFTAGNTESTTMRGAAILLAAESSRCSIVQPRPPIAPISLGGRDDAAHGVVRRANVRVRIDESGGDELAVAIDLVVAGARPAFRVDGLVRRAHVD